MTTHIHQGNTQSQNVDASVSATCTPEPSSAENLDYQQTHDKTPILKVRDLTKRYPVKTSVFSRKKSYVHALEHVSFDVHKGETFAIVGESGCGKSTTGKCILRLNDPTSGTVELNGCDFTALKGSALIEARKSMKLIFQDPYSSLNPRMTVADIIAEPIDIAHSYASREERERMIEDVMEHVGLDLSYKNRYPHEFSGGQRQRIGIARAIILLPKLIICDEPVSALDVSVQAKVINLLKELQKKLGLAYIFISHDLSVVKHISDTVMVMYLGHTMERGSKNDLFSRPLHPYTQALLDVIPRIAHERIQDKRILQGDVPSPVNPPSGCVFHTRCPLAQSVCAQKEPDLVEIEPGHVCACHVVQQRFAKSLEQAHQKLCAS